MFYKLIPRSGRKLYQIFQIRTQSTWDIVTSVCIERLPVVTPPLNEIQMKYMSMLQKIEVENSLKSDHELRHEHDKVQAELLKMESIDLDAVSQITAQDFEDSSNEELAKFKFADIETEADKKCDKQSLERCLQRHLVLVTQQKLGEEFKTLFPQGLWREGETLRQTAERIVNEQCGTDLKVKFLGNAPCGFYKYKYPSGVSDKAGAKVFFYYASYVKGSTTNKDQSNSQWLTRTELNHTLPKRYSQSVNEFLIHETY